MTVRTVESHWFVWVTQMSHLSMAIGKYKDVPQHDWPSLQVLQQRVLQQRLFGVSWMVLVSAQGLYRK